MKLVVQIPCFNEAATLPFVFRDMPRSIPGIDELEFQIIDDGSTDETIRVARELGVHQVVRVSGPNRRWLGRAFKLGVDHALKRGADIVVNTDGDNQYPSGEIAALIAPILAGEADIVIADRNPGSWQEFSPLKRFLQRFGNKVVQFLIGRSIPDAVSGFRAYSRESLLQLHLMTNFTYTIDTLIQAHKKGLSVVWMPVRPNPKTRESRLISSNLHKVTYSGLNILRLICVYEPFRVFLLAGLFALLPGVILLARFLYFYFFEHQEAAGHIQSVVIGGALVVIAVQLFLLSVVGGLLGINRRLLEEMLTRLRRMEIDSVQAEPTAIKQPAAMIRTANRN